jgi:hypothetical protein
MTNTFAFLAALRTPQESLLWMLWGRVQVVLYPPQGWGESSVFDAFDPSLLAALPAALFYCLPSWRIKPAE